MEEKEQKVSKFSSGLNIIIRLDILWRDTHKHSRSGKFDDWNKDLDRIWCELARDLNDEEYEKEQEKFDKFDGELIKLGPFIDNPPAGFKELTKEQIENRNKQYKILIAKELYLRRLENSLGKGTTWDEEDYDGFD